jgi:endogenous inhibitor of DNA gyrase (YacG/DUF329 family)
MRKLKELQPGEVRYKGKICKKVSCQNCGKEVIKSKYELTRNSTTFCSTRCSLFYFNNWELDKETRKTCICDNCKKEFIKLIRNIGNRNFCSKNCAISFNSKKRKKVAFCPNCGKQIENSSKWKKMFCSSICQKEYPYKEYIKRWKEGLETGYNGNSFNISDYVRKYLFIKYGGKCSKCGWEKINETTGKKPLQVNHIDGDVENNKEGNLELLCPNCHSLTPNFGSLNKGSKRFVERRRIRKEIAKYLNTNKKVSSGSTPELL